LVGKVKGVGIALEKQIPLNYPLTLGSATLEEINSVDFPACNDDNINDPQELKYFAQKKKKRNRKPPKNPPWR